MCGIFGLLGPRGDAAEGLARMNRQLAHRGPDGEGLERLEGAFLGHRRLSIIDLSPTGAQPMWDVDRRACITFNGEIYNYRELREECVAAGARFRGASDTEVILTAYLQRGPSAFARLNGMFAFCLVDARSGDAYLARDAAGIKPLYYGQTPRGFAFASELGAFLTTGWLPFEVDPAALQAYLQLDFVPAPLSMLRGVSKLPGGMMLRRTREGEVSIRPFTEAPRACTPSGATAAADVDRLDDVLQRVVARQLVADVPVGVFLSGGIDSTLVADAATRAAGRIGTFSVGFEDASFDERPFFDEVARTLGSTHHAQVITSATMSELVPRMAEVVTEPLADGSIFPTYFLTRFTRERVKVVLSGDGADELFAGYPTHQVSRWGTLLAKAPGPVLSMLRGSAHALLPVSHANLSLDFKVKKFLEGLHPDPILQNERWLGSFMPEEVPGLMVSHDESAQASLVALLHEPATGLRGLEALLHADRRYYLQDQVLVKADRASMANSLEVRVPFLDDEMVAFANGLPASRKLRGRTTKWILRELARRRFSPAIWRRPKKGFGAPLARWFRGELRSWVRDTLSPERIARWGYLKPAPVARLLDEHERGTRDHRKRIFNLLMFIAWCEWAREQGHV